ncbi:MAG TPA: class I SAM-dependent methyltransferase [Streptosporangiaceae bacterium]|jgi:SAM-dependent methyltransferase
MVTRHQDVVASMRAAYESAVARRDKLAKEPWKITERGAFLRRLQDEGARKLLEIGPGTGADSAAFQAAGLQVTATDLSPAMVARCRARGIDAREMDVLHLGFPPGHFDAAYSLNCLLHVPNADLPAALESIATVLRPGGLFFLGVYSGESASEGPGDFDDYDPPRFFSWRTDEQIERFARRSFEVEDFHIAGTGHTRFQSLTLRRPGRPA